MLNNRNFKQKLSSFYDYLERNENSQNYYYDDDNDDTKSCINMKLKNYNSRQQTTFSNNIDQSNNSRNVLKLLNSKHQQENKNEEEIYSCLFTPRLTNKKQQQQQKDASYLTWKTFNCNPIPNFTKETAIINEDDDDCSQQQISSSNNKTYRCNFSNQNLGVIYDDECDLNNKENFNYSRDSKKNLSMSTPATPLLSSSCTLPR